MGYWKSLLPSQDCEGLAGNSTAPTCVTSIVGENCVYVVDPQRPMFPGKETPMNSKNVIANATIAGSFAAALTMITAPGLRSAEAAAAHHGQMLRHRTEGRQRLRG